ncbi:heme exporter protein CcmD [Sphingomonas psychrotolerans]|uniref:Heme exporter protein D n=1 Tax=Sphingomonas psychrotolerans TaxID=1327635 RepID=A0ABU3N161_9SPHN|nr:heme exporter protein CcmD [Sphingomonas psychrotolerans]MDT8758277.1 heme exporter protein CcmD [Sphingomonas psychrotolerans]
MNHWAFVTAAYAVTLLGTGGLAGWAWHSMRRAEAAAESLRRER